MHHDPATGEKHVAEESTGDDDDGTSSGTTTGTTTDTTSDTTTGTTTETTEGCYDEEGALRLPGDTVGVGQDLCTADQINGMWDACLGGSGSSEANCAAWMDEEANQACSGCVLGSEPPAETGPMPVVLLGNEHAYLAQMACEAVIADLPDCAWPMQALTYCETTACETCETKADDDACSDEALYSSCADLAGAIPTECGPILELEGWSPECDPDAYDSGGLFTFIATKFCGPPAE